MTASDEPLTFSSLSRTQLAALLDHTLLKPEASREDIVRLCAEAAQEGTASVCVNPIWVATAAQQLSTSPVKVCTVVGFPLGATTTEAKVAETQQALRDGAEEIDMVINIAAARAGESDVLVNDISAVVDAVTHPDHVVKVIVETALLDDDAIVLACQAAVTAGAHFVKTSTGFSSAGATIEHVALMRATVGPEIGVKASGGIRDRSTAIAMLNASATRLGVSATLAILD